MTGILELDKIKNILALGQCGYTLTQGFGYWKGNTEHTAIIEIYGDYNLGIIQDLKRELKQDSILVAESITEVNFNE